MYFSVAKAHSRRYLLASCSVGFNFVIHFIPTQPTHTLYVLYIVSSSRSFALTFYSIPLYDYSLTYDLENLVSNVHSHMMNILSCCHDGVIKHDDDDDFCAKFHSNTSTE